MCRLAIYMGDPIIMSHFVTDPNHSIIKQSSQATLEAQLQLNGDGFGIGWYVHDISPFPSIFSETTPAWSNCNLIELSKLTKSGCILTHVRQASPGSAVVATNCHPFKYKKFTFMHNGFVKNFSMIKRKIVNMLSEEIYLNIKGSTDSEYMFALFLNFYQDIKRKYPKEKKIDAMVEAIYKVITAVDKMTLETRKKEEDKSEQFFSLLNFVVTDGHRLVATRYTTGPLKGAHTMFYCTGRCFKCHSSGCTSVEKNHDVCVKEHDDECAHENMVIIASEPLTDEIDFKEIPPNYMIIADRSTIGLKSFAKKRSRPVYGGFRIY